MAGRGKRQYEIAPQGARAGRASFAIAKWRVRFKPAQADGGCDFPRAMPEACATYAGALLPASAQAGEPRINHTHTARLT